jgi:hypothetical protein
MISPEIIIGPKNTAKTKAKTKVKNQAAALNK